MQMTEQDKLGFRKLLTAAYKIYDKRVAESDLKLWYECLKSYSPENIRLAFSQHLQTNKWCPRPAEIIEILRLAEDSMKVRYRPKEIVHKMTPEERAEGLKKFKEMTEGVFK